jgi:hypothetical protein
MQAKNMSKANAGEFNWHADEEARLISTKFCAISDLIKEALAAEPIIHDKNIEAQLRNHAEELLFFAASRDMVVGMESILARDFISRAKKTDCIGSEISRRKFDLAVNLAQDIIESYGDAKPQPDSSSYFRKLFTTPLIQKIPKLIAGALFTASILFVPEIGYYSDSNKPMILGWTLIFDVEFDISLKLLLVEWIGIGGFFIISKYLLGELRKNTA